MVAMAGRSFHQNIIWLSVLLHEGIFFRPPDVDKWFMSLGPVQGTATLGWPCDVQISGGVTFVSPSGSVHSFADLSWFVLTDPSNWKALDASWVSPAKAQLLSGGIAQTSIKAAARGGEKSLMEVCAAKAFFRLGLLAVRALCGDQGVTNIGGESLFSHLKALVQHVLGCTDEECMAILEQRLAAPTSQYSDLLKDDAVAECLGDGDQAIYKAYVEADPEHAEFSAGGFHHDRGDFRSEYKAKRQSLAKNAVRSSSASSTGTDVAMLGAAAGGPTGLALAAGSGRGKGRGKGRGMLKKGTEAPEAPQEKVRLRAIPWPTSLTHDFAMSLLPPRGRISQDAANNRWLGELRPHGTVSRSWPLYGESQALVLVASQLWAWHSAATGDDCPWQDMLEASL